MKHKAILVWLDFAMLGHALWPLTAALLAMMVFAFSPVPLHTASASSVSGLPFTVVAIPDTQGYSEWFPQIFAAQTAWIAANKDALNIKMVTHEGDIVNYPQLPEQWQAASAALANLDGWVPYAIAPGNHDFNRDGVPVLYREYFPVSRLRQGGGWGGSFGDKNMFRTFVAGNQPFVMMNLEFCPSDETLQWAGDVLHTYANHKAIITTHSMLDAEGKRTTNGECDYYHNEGFNAGADIWRVLVKEQKNHNIMLFLSGHNMPATGGVRRVDWVEGRPIHQVLANYQHFVNAGDGFLRLMTFVPATRKILVETYSPFNGQFLSDGQNFFELEW